MNERLSSYPPGFLPHFYEKYRSSNPTLIKLFYDRVTFFCALIAYVANEFARL